ncbi:copper-binding protein [Pseudomonas sp. MAFF212428]|uniref:Copper-binding protein n=1 Tax=Pseudomonas brassicae TaxID=2708063 RepID=A0A6B3NZV3_9PSED|nr:plastocyanin/azurin family copper-binding protein [Pseudomonas brassicae]NER61941.1 copper-binding protein [Pseudomonas brassicae]NER66701.1 copper-binding protein [Pseudomonas brassicae]
MKHLMIAGALALSSMPLLAAPGHDYAFGAPAAAAQATRTVEVVMGDMYFEPRALTVKAGETVRFVLLNQGQVAHEFNLGDAAMHARHQQQMAAMQGQMDHSAMGHGGMDHAAMGHGGMRHDDPNMLMVAPGQRAELTWTFSQSTPIQFACNVPGHYQAGMVGTLTIAQ